MLTQILGMLSFGHISRCSGNGFHSNGPLVEALEGASIMGNGKGSKYVKKHKQIHVKYMLVPNTLESDC